MRRLFTRFSSLLLSLIWLIPAGSVAQVTSAAETIGVISTGQTPFWIQSNQNGMIAGNGSHLLARFNTNSRHTLNSQITVNYGLDLIARPGIESTLSLNQGYVKMRGYGIEMSAGRFINTSPIHDEETGMGSLGVSGNASPVPQIRLGLTDWTAIPFTHELIKLRAHISHGWLGTRRFTKNTFLHEKVGHARFGGDFPLNLYGGIAHYSIWGGEDNPRFGDMPSSLKDFGRVFIVSGGSDDAPYGEQAYMLGDHKGAWDFGFFLELDELTVTGYRQFPLETKNNLKFKSLQDALTGISISFNESSLLQKLTYEFLYTKYQNGPLEVNTDPDRRDDFQGNENYYNHTIYWTGWTYNSRTIGNPLFIPKDNKRGVSNNGIVAHHLGTAFNIGPASLKTRATFSRNYGIQDINPDTPDEWTFESPRNQWSFGAGIESPFSFGKHQFDLLVELAYDNGSLVGDQFGSLIGIRWNR